MKQTVPQSRKKEVGEVRLFSLWNGEMNTQSTICQEALLLSPEGKRIKLRAFGYFGRTKEHNKNTSQGKNVVVAI